MKNIHLQPKLLFGLILMGIVLMVALTITIMTIYRSHMETQYSQSAFKMATTVANLIDGSKIAKYRNTLEKDDYYEETRNKLNMIRAANDLKYLYVVIPEDTQFYIWDTGSEEDIAEGNVCDLGDTDEYLSDDADDIMLSAFNADDNQVMVVTNSDKYGYLASAYVAILDAEGKPAALASVDISLDAINNEIRQFVTLLALVSFAILLVSSILYYFYIRRILIKPIKTLHSDTEKLVRDNMEDLDDFKNRVHTGDELEELGTSFEYMTKELSAYITNLASVTAEKERIGAELNIASQIQADMLPRIFPAFPGRPEFDIYASMTPAKEVGGDFYDFFLIDDDHIGLVMADVSGKGVPAALFMVIAKTLIKNQAQISKSPAEILKRVNEQLCEGNEAELFVTVWLAVVQISTGKGFAANAGHEHPVICRANGDFELIEYRHSPAVATMEGIRFREHEFQLNPGDKLFVYTDGVPEATNAQNELFGTTRMLEVLNSNKSASPKELLDSVREGIDAFVGSAPQFDDITMMDFLYLGQEDNDDSILILEAKTNNLDRVLEFIDGNLEKNNCSQKTKMQIDVAVEELFVNIAHYAYNTDIGSASIHYDTENDQKYAVITFKDSGVPYNPLEKPDPDLTLSAEERPIGGLGIYMVKKTMDDVTYEYKDGQNILTIKKLLNNDEEE